MSREDDDAWWDTLTGRAVDNSAPRPPDADALRRAILAEHEAGDEAAPGGDGLLRLLVRLRKEGLLEDAPRWRGYRLPRALAAGFLLLALAVPVAYQFMPPTPMDADAPVFRGAVEPQSLRAPHPEATAMQLVAALRRLGLEADATPYGDYWLVEADIPANGVDGLAEILEEQGLTTPVGGSLRVLVSPRP